MYIGQDLQVAYPSYLVIDDISGSFNGVTTSFALTVNGSTPVPLPINSQQCLISVGGVVQRPDDTGAEGFRLSGSNIVFSSAPNTGEDFFGTILAGADYVNAGVTYPSGSAAAPSITFDSDPDTGIYNAAANQVGVTCAGSTVSVFSSSGQSFLAGSAGSPSIYASGDTNTGIFFPAADTIAFAEGGAEAARIDSSGRLLVGTSSTSADTRLTVQGRSGDATSYAEMYLQRGGSPSSGQLVGRINFADSSSNVYADIQAAADATTGSGDYPGRLIFSTTADGASSPTERMRITSTGKTSLVAAAGTSAAALNWENSTNSSGAFAGISYLGSNCNNTSSYHYIAVTGGADKYYIYGNGTTATPSDINLKKNIETTRDGYLEDLCRLRVVKYNWNEQADDDPKELGVIAQELEQVFPGLVQKGPEKEDGSSYKAVKTSVLPFMLLKALQEAAAKIETLEAKVAALEAA